MFNKIKQGAEAAAKAAEAAAKTTAKAASAGAHAVSGAVTGEDEKKKREAEERARAQAEAQHKAEEEKKKQEEEVARLKREVEAAQQAAAAAQQAAAAAEAKEAERKAAEEKKRKEEEERKRAEEEARQKAEEEEKKRLAAEEARRAEAARKYAEEQEAKRKAEVAARKAAEEKAQAEIKADAEKLRAAMKGFGTNEQALIDILGTKTDVQMSALVATYNAIHQRDLLKDLKDECTGSFEDTLVALCTQSAHYDAQCIRSSVKGLGTDEKLLIETLCTRSPSDLRALVSAYKIIYGRDILTDIEADVNGHLQKLLICLLTQPRKEDGKEDLDGDVKALYEAGEAKTFGTSKGVFIRMLGEHSREYCEKLYYKYAEKHGKALDRVLREQLGGLLGDRSLVDALATLVTPLDVYYSDKLYDSMKGAGTDDKTLIRIIVSQRDRSLKAAAKRFLNIHKKTLKVWVGEECAGNYKKLLIKLCETFATN